VTTTVGRGWREWAERVGLHNAEAPTLRLFSHQAILFGALTIAMGFNIFADVWGDHPGPFEQARYLGGLMLLPGAVQIATGVQKGFLLGLSGLPPDAPTISVDGQPLADAWRRKWMLRSLVATATLLTFVVTCTGGPFKSPFGQYLLGSLILAQILAPRPGVAPLVLGITCVLATFAGIGSWWLPVDGLRNVGSSWTAWHLLPPAAIIALSSTLVNASSIATAAAARRQASRPAHE
jgi:hypothetical protein